MITHKLGGGQGSHTDKAQNINFQKELHIMEITRLLRTHADEWFVSRLLCRARQHLQPDQQPT